MGGQYADPVDVQRRDRNPAAFCWRGRIYLVHGVRAHWVETGPWWQSASVRALLAGTAADNGCSVAASGTPPPSTEREFWQVEARPRRGAARGVYELCADWSSGHEGSWSVTTDGEVRTGEGSQHGGS